MSEDSPSRRPGMAVESCGAAEPAAEAGDTPAPEVILVEEPLSKGRRSRHRTLLVVACIVVVSSALFNVRDDQRVEIRGLPGIPMPETCWSRSLFHVKCPGCGLTRSIVYLAHGNWRASWQMHRIGFIMALAILAQFPYCIVGLRYKKDYPLGRRFASIVAWTLILLLMGNWLFDVFTSAA